MKKVVKKQLKENEFVSTMTKVLHFIKRRSREILIISASLAFGVLLFFGVRFIQAQNIKKDNERLSQILALKSELRANPEKLAQLTKLAGQGKLTRLAFIIEASSWVEKGEVEKAEEVLARFPLQPRDFLYYQGQDLLGQIMLFQKKFDQAIAIFEKVEKEKPKDYGLDVVLFHKAEALEAKGDRDAALAVYKSIQEKFPQSYYGFDAGERARKLEAGVAAATRNRR
ncbi:MAG: tetratricopeptide repeat protein [Candidatus Aminicenantales bacterium]